jgi:RND family efflux transporter MFP subunit
MTEMTLTHRRRRASVTLALSIFAAACSRSTARAPGVPLDPVSVTVATVAIGDVAGTFEAGGVVQAGTTATLTARILAPVTEVRATPGDRVRAGQVLVVLDGSDLEARARSARALALSADRGHAAAEAERQAAEAGLALARATYARITGLHAKRSATTQELDTATGALRAAEARVASAAASVEAAAASVESARAAGDAAAATESFARIAAPFDGVVTEKMVEPGNTAAPGTPLLRLEDTRQFRLDVRVDESRVAQVSPGDGVQVSLDAGADGRPTVVGGTVTEIGRAVDAGARTFLVKIRLPAGPGLRSGMFGRAQFSTQRRRALTVPAGALVRRGQMTSVFVVEQDIARLRLVSVSGTEVLAGLSAGEVVVVTPPSALTDGRRVNAGRQ